MHPIIVVGAFAAVGVLAVGLAIFLFEDNRKERPHGPRRPPSSPSSRSNEKSPPSPSIRRRGQRDQATSPTPTENFRTDTCKNCNLNSTRGNLMTFYPCECCFLCRECAMQYLRRSVSCPWCSTRIVDAEGS